MWLDYALENLFVQPEQGKVDRLSAEVYRRAKSLGASTFCLGNVLASARHAYGTPWVSALQIPRRSDDVFVFFAARDDGLTCAFYVLAARGAGDEGMYVGEPTLCVGESTYRGVTEDCWDAFSKDKLPTQPGVYGGELSTVETAL